MATFYSSQVAHTARNYGHPSQRPSCFSIKKKKKKKENGLKGETFPPPIFFSWDQYKIPKIQEKLFLQMIFQVKKNVSNICFISQCRAKNKYFILPPQLACVIKQNNNKTGVGKSKNLIVLFTSPATNYFSFFFLFIYRRRGGERDYIMQSSTLATGFRQYLKSPAASERPGSLTGHLFMDFAVRSTVYHHRRKKKKKRKTKNKGRNIKNACSI